MKRLYISISHHGLGHLAQTAPVLHALRARQPDLEFVVQSALPLAHLEARLPGPFTHLSATPPRDTQLSEAAETAFVMHDALRVDVPASRAAFAAFHARLSQRIDALAGDLDRLKVDAVFSNVAYLPLLAAQRSGRSAWACCSLNWADIYAHYLGRDATWEAMAHAYAGASAFFQPAPSMVMDGLTNRQPVGPLARHGLAHRTEMAAALNIDAEHRWWLVGMGGFGWQAPAGFLPRRSGHVWLLPDDWPGPLREDQRRFTASGFGFMDVLASSDGLLTKPGYGSFVEATTLGLDVLYLPRPDWPESPALTRWLHAHTRAAEVGLAEGDVGTALTRIEALPRRTVPRADGADAIATRILSGS